MNSTTKCWFIANFEVFLYLITVFISTIVYMISFEMATALKISFYFALGLGFFNIPVKSGIFQYGKFILMLGLAILFTIGITETDNSLIGRTLIWSFWIVFAIASFISGVLAYYTYHNMDEVVSRRMLWRNSNVSLYEYTWKYTLDRFCNITTSIVTCSLYLIFLLVAGIGSLFTS